MLRHLRNVHAGESRRGGGEGSGGGGVSEGGEGKSVDRKPFFFGHPFTANITGPTGCAKTYFVKTLLQNCRTKMAPPSQSIVWLHKRWQPLYDEISRTVVPRVEFDRGIPSDLDGDHYFEPQIRNVIILEDLMSITAKDSRINDLFTEGSPHRNISVVMLNENLFFGKDPTQRKNCHYIVLFNNPVDRQPIATLGRQTYHSRRNFLLQKFDEATKEYYSYLVVDLKQTTSDSLRLRIDALGTSIEKEKNEEEEEEDEENLEKEEGEEEQEEHSDLLACRPCGLLFAHAWDLKDYQIRGCPVDEHPAKRCKREDDGVERTCDYEIKMLP
jgi:hypothetical protein